MGRLRNLEVERVDAVGSPASGHKWVILKSDNAAVEKAATIEKAAGDALTALLKEAGLSFSKDTVSALKALAAALELDEAEFTEKAEEVAAVEAAVEKGDDDDTDADPEGDKQAAAAADAPADDDDEIDADADKDVEKTSYTADEVDAIIAKALDKFGVDVTAIQKGIVTGTTRLVAKSKQPKEVAKSGDRQAVKKGQGLFEDVIFNQD